MFTIHVLFFFHLSRANICTDVLEQTSLNNAISLILSIPYIILFDLTCAWLVHKDQEKKRAAHGILGKNSRQFRQ